MDYIKLSPPAGAPKANWTSGSGQGIPSPGAVYSCELEDIGDPTSEQVCSEQVILEELKVLLQPQKHSSGKFLQQDMKYFLAFYIMIRNISVYFTS